VEDACRQCEKDLFSERRHGATRFRRIHLHNAQFCSTEQTVSMTIATDGSQWTGENHISVFLDRLIDSLAAVSFTDQGRSIMENNDLLWSRYNSNGFNGRPVGTLPLVPYNIPAEICQSPSESLLVAQNCLPQLDQFHPLKNVLVRDATDLELLSEDPFCLLWTLMTISATSWSQMLNYLSESVVDYQTTMPGQLSFTLDQLRYHIGITNRVKESLTRHLHWIEQGGCPSWPKASNHTLQARKSHLQQQSRADHL
jgi:hypothetical protein